MDRRQLDRLVNAYRPHGILVARHGKLVVEEYFFGERAGKPTWLRATAATSRFFVPDLDLVIVSTGGNCSDRATFVMLTEIIPKYILPSVVD